ncbi:hypothetical protein CYLTODRAFT_397408 [Cylindrobasidium torrendii FP15055 ss-10]|uniref:PH domain-containing protein n=1 Tax=Cylindrobasidium torrendii FP15055 ss-10 TaxID=1314674 RepID=A0A0D7BAV0_9AGAR|nr:hypothetical protein CYLTODRAFT_397408 [Cylindrobasidium torrendii FP15055 ss-10]
MSTSSSPSASPTPRWDSRSSGFISPRRLQELKQNAPKHAFGSTGRHSSDLTGMDTPSQPPQQQQRPASAHSRPSSFFSFRSHKQVSEAPSTASRQSTGTNPMLSRAQSNTPPTSTPDAGPRPTSSGGPPPTGANGSTLTRSPSGPGPGPGTLQLHPEIRSVVGLTVAHAHKIYFSGPLVRKIERGPEGQRPSKDEGWSEVWAQLGGTTLSIWDMKLIKEASNQGREVPPTYVNVTDAFVSVLGSVTVPAQNGAPPQRYANVLTLNTAGSNLLLFSCPNSEALISWATALRLCSWEKSRLEEIYTAHLIRITLSARDIPSTLIRGRMEGWARVRISGQTDWKRVWLQVSAAIEPELALNNSSSIGATPTFGSKKKRMSGIFNRETSPTPSGPMKATVSMYISHKPKDRRRPLLSLTDVTQAFAVYPERPELISKSTLLKIEARLGTEEVAGGMRGREGYVLVMPELEGGLSQAAEMLKWVVAIHDAFALYGRPQAWTWDPREPTSLMFAYPVGPMKDALFLDREQAESLDPRDDGTATVRSRLLSILFDRMRGVQKPAPANGPGPQLPPLSFDNVHPQHERHLLTPITEKSSIMTHGRALSVDGQSILNPRQSIHGQSIHGVPSTVPEHPSSESSVVRSGIQLSDGPSIHNNSEVLNAHNRGYTQDSNHIADARQNSVGQEGAFSPTPRKPMESGPSFINSPTLSSSGSAPNSPPMESVAAPSHSMRTGSPNSMLTSPFSIAARAEDKESQRAPSPSSMLTSPFSMATRMEQQHSQGSLRSQSPSSMLTSPFSAAVHNGGKDEESDATPPVSPRTQSSAPARSMLAMPVEPIPASGTSTESGFGNEAGALYYMRYNEEHASGSGSGSGSGANWGGNAVASSSGNAPPASREVLNVAPLSSRATATPPQSPPPRPPSKSPTTETSFGSPYTRPTPLSPSPIPERRMTEEPMSPESTYSRSSASSSFRAPVRKGTPMAFAAPLEAERSATPPPTPPTVSASTSASPLVADRRVTPISSRQALGRKPSGARAPNKSTTRSQPPSQSVPPVDEERDEDEKMDADPKQRVSAEDDHLDAITALAYLQVEDNPPPPPPPEPRRPAVRQQSREPPQYPVSSEAPPSPASGPGQFRSSFAPSKQAAERKARAEANQAAQQAAAHRPGRTHGRKKSAAWNDSSDEEDEEEEEDEDDADSDREPSAPSAPRSAEAHGGPRSSNGHADPRSNTGYGDGRSAIGHGDMRSAHGHGDARSALGHGDSRSAIGHGDQDQSGPYSHARPPRNLPQIPAGRPHPDWEDPSQPSYTRQRTPSNVRPDTQRFTSYDTPPENSMPPPPMPGAVRQNNIWSQVLDPNNNVGAPERDTFVQMESQAATMTKAFTPHGLLSAGMQDKNDRSAKRQEEVARETGASLVNVPHKPPPPQLGLLGAISAHERDKQREGGIGATLTQREREKRAVEEKQRRMDEQQRQLEQMGSMYGGYNPMMNPMMMNPMMMGMPPMQGMSPMMTGGSMQGGMNPMMSGFPGMFNPQHMFAAQQAAAQAYQQAMVQLSIAGSQAGGESVVGSQQPNPMQPTMTGQGSMMNGQGSMMGGMGGFDPRMSMMNPMMMMGMGMGGMGMGMGGMNPGMMPQQQSANGSPMLPPGAGTFDARFGPPSPGELLPPSVLGGGSPRPGSGNASPVGRGSPLARAVDASSRPVTPKN